MLCTDASIEMNSVFRSSYFSQVFLDLKDPCVVGICCRANLDYDNLCDQNTFIRHIFSHLHAVISMSHVKLAQGVLRVSRHVIMRLVVRLI